MRAEDHIAEGPTLLSASGEVPPQPERLAEGARAGDYEIEGLLGGGAMGDVYAGRHPLIGKRVAVKVIKRHLAAAPDAIERFLREARAVNQVGHPNVVDVFAVGRLDDGRLYLVMDLLEGEALGARLRRGRMPVEEALDVLDAIAVALDAAHARGVVHRDLKPDNVFLAERPGADKPAVFVLDFGIAKLLSTGDGAVRPGTLTDQGTWLGTPAYMAPEQWGADGAGPASDRYALGVIAFEVLAGRAPFQAGSLPAMMEKHFRAPVPSLATGEGVALPPAVDVVLGRALAKDPDLRYESARAMVAALRAALGTTAGRHAPVARARGARRPVPTLAIVLGAATAVAAIATAILVLGGGSREESAAPTAPAVSGEVVEITSAPSGARVRIGGVDRGVTPLALPREELGRGDATVLIDKPGYLATARTVGADEGAKLDVVLQPVKEFEGLWALPDGTLRSFERRGEQVAMFSLESGTSEKNFERFFEFVAADAGQVRFVAAEEHVDGRAPDEPSCHVGLRAEYVYEPEQDHLARRMERVQLDYAGGRCALRAKEWGDAADLRRLATAEDAGWVESRAGSGNPVSDEKVLVPEVPFPGDEKQEKKKAPARKPQKKAPPPDKSDAKGGEKPQANAPPPEAQNQAARGTTEKTPVGVDIKKRPQKTRPEDGASQQQPPPIETLQQRKD